MTEWLEGVGLGQYEAMFEENDIDFDILVELTEDDLRELPISFGHRKRLVKAIAQHNAAQDSDNGAAAAQTESPPQTPAEKPAPEPEAKVPPESFIEGERRQLTVLFCDLVGSTAMAAGRDPEETYGILTAYHTTCSQIIDRYGGHIARVLGDGVLAYFGFPVAREGEAERAVRASLELVDAVRGMDVGKGLSLDVRIGIDTGLVVIGDLVGQNSAEEDAIFGDTPNLAARLQALAQPGQIMISQNTRRLVGSLFELEDQEAQQLKGFALPVRPFRVKGEAATESRFAARRGASLAPLVGREHELALLMARWRSAQAGEGQVVVVSGDGGIGKSHLVQQMRDAVRPDAPQVLLYECSQLHANSAYHVMAEQLLRAARIQPNDDPETKLTKLETLVLPGIDAQDAVPLLGFLTGVSTLGRYPELTMPPEARKAAVNALMARQLDTLCAAGPVLVTIEDAHWMDPSTAEYLAQTIARAHELPVMFVITHRPEVEFSWSAQIEPTRLNLTRLDRVGASAVIDRVSGGKLPERVKQQIMEKAEGVPLYLEEITKAVIESRGISAEKTGVPQPEHLTDLTIPSTLHDSLMARLDRLSSVKEVVQVAAVLGRTFSVDLLEGISQIDEGRLKLALVELVSAELLYRRGLPPNEIYAFKHALLQDTAYTSQLRSKRQRLHARTADMMERSKPEIMAESPEVLAYHWREAGELQRARPHYMAAGELALSRYANTEARVRFNEALEASTDTRGQAEAILARAKVPGSRTEIQADQAALVSIRNDVEALNDDVLLAQIDYWVGRLHYIQGNLDGAVAGARAAFDRADGKEGGQHVVADASNLLARILGVESRPRDSIRYATRNIELMAELNNPIEQAGITSVLAFANGVYGDFDAAVEAANQGIALAETLDHLPTRAAGYFYRGVVLGWRGDVEDADADYAEAIRLSKEANDLFRVYVCHGWRGQAYLHVGEYAAAEVDLDAALTLSTQIGTGFHRAAFQAFRAELDLRRGQPNLSDAELAVASSEGQPWANSIALRVFGETVGQQSFDQGYSALQSALLLQRERECGYDMAWSLLGLARMMALHGKHDKAVETAKEAETAFINMGVAAGVVAARELL